MYKADSKIAEEFIDHQEILDTLEYAHNNKSNRALIQEDPEAEFRFFGGDLMTAVGGTGTGNLQYGLYVEGVCESRYSGLESNHSLL